MEQINVVNKIRNYIDKNINDNFQISREIFSENAKIQKLFNSIEGQLFFLHAAKSNILKKD